MDTKRLWNIVYKNLRTAGNNSEISRYYADKYVKGLIW